MTEEQVARLPVFREEYLKHGISTAPADRPGAEAAFARAYRAIGKEPVPVIWVSSPLSASLAFAALEHSALGGQIGNQLRGQLGESLQSAKITPQYTYWWGQQDLYWVAFYKFAAEIGVKYDESAADRLNIMREIGLSCMWWYPRDGLIIACDRPLAVNFDDRGRLHNDNGPAVEFRDGWKLYAVHGVRLPAWIMEDPARVTLGAIDAEENSEIQRVMIERFGWDRYAAECGAEVIDHDDRGGTLFRRKTSAGDPIVYLEVINRSAEPDGTFRHYILPVHPECCPLPDPEDPRGELGDPQAVTALNAVASTFGMKGAKYRRLVGAES